ncbi:MAG: hypothetical protein JSV03_04890 [Planctomycetota bacterium]|nr:MAG: hypothetical protein JSV03_04890 [Planctomycetota bacterium]
MMIVQREQQHEIRKKYKRKISDYIQRLNSLTSERIGNKNRITWCYEVNNQLEQLLKELCENKTVRKLYILASNTRPQIAHKVKKVERELTILQSEICDVIYLLKNIGLSQEVSDLWIKKRIKRFMENKSIIDELYSHIVQQIK